MGNWYRVSKKIHGRFYDYWQRTERHGQQVKTFNKYIGPSGGRITNALASYDALAHEAQKLYDRGQLLTTSQDPSAPAARQEYHDAFEKVARYQEIVLGHPIDDWARPKGSGGGQLYRRDFIEELKKKFRSPPLSLFTCEICGKDRIVRNGKKHCAECDKTHDPFGLAKGAYFCKRCETQTDRVDWEGKCYACEPSESNKPSRPLPSSAGTFVHPRPENSPMRPRTSEEAADFLRPSHASMTGKDARDYAKQNQREIHDNESVQYGSVKQRKASQDAKVRAAKRKSRGTGAANPFLGQAIKKKK